jgi:sulfonate transport system ATP-binding protein
MTGNTSAAEPRAPLRSEPLIRFESVEQCFGDLTVVRNLDLAVYQGEFICLVGPSGCGKSTLLNITAGLFSPTRGTVFYRGRPVKVINRQTGYMTQSDHLLPWRSTFGNIAVPLEIMGKPCTEITAKVTELIQLVGLAGFEQSYPLQLSGGMRNRTALARLLACDPETLLMDEPFGALDAQLRLILQIEVKRLCREFGKTVLFVTHDIDEAVALADRIVVFTSRPSTILEIVENRLPRDRNLKGLRFNSDYIAQCAALWRLLSPQIDSQASKVAEA